jgi:predicted Zn-dependent protease
MPRCFLFLLVLMAPATSARQLFLVESLAAQAEHAPVRAAARELELIYSDLARVSGVDATLVWSTDPDINAFATEVGRDRIVVVQEGLLRQFEGDRDAVAATLGHELAHHHADHIGAGRRKQEGVRVLGAILGAVVGAKVGNSSGELAGAVSGAAVGVGANLLALKFNRNQELEADRLALQWMVAAGYNPQGMLRLQQRLGEIAGQKRRAAILSTHPTSSKRLAAARKRVDALAPPQDLLARAPAPLVGPESIVAARDAIATADARAQETRIAQGEAVDGAAAEAAALQPEARAEAATNGVRIGEGVKIGRGVRIGGREVAPDRDEASED